MKTIGLLGGMSWESTATYYRLLNQGVRDRLGGLNSAELLIASVNFCPVEEMMRAGNWQGCGDLLAHKGRELEGAGAELLLLCTNTMHKVAEQIAEQVNIPLLHIADACARQITTEGVSHVGLLGTLPTMEDDFYTGRLTQHHGLRITVPDQVGRHEVHRIIFHELCLGRVLHESKEFYLRTVAEMQAKGIEGLIAGCTEIAMLLDQSDLSIPFYDTTSLHVAAALDMALN